VECERQGELVLPRDLRLGDYVIVTNVYIVRGRNWGRWIIARLVCDHTRGIDTDDAKFLNDDEYRLRRLRFWEVDLHRYGSPLNHLWEYPF